MLYVEDEGVGISPEQIEEFEKGKKSSGIKEGRLTGIGLHHVDECIRLTFGEEYGLKISRNAEKGTVVQFLLPVLERQGQSTEAEESV